MLNRHYPSIILLLICYAFVTHLKWYLYYNGYMKNKKLLSLITSGILLLTPFSAFAQDIDATIQQKQARLQELAQEESDVKRQIQSVIDDVVALNNSQIKLNQEIAQISETMAQHNLEIDRLNYMILKRDESARQQAKLIQTTDTVTHVLDLLFTSESLLSFFERLDNMSRLMSASQEIMLAQIRDKDELERLKQELSIQFNELIEKVNVLQQQQVLLEEKQVALDGLLVNLAISQANEREDIAALEQEKAAIAERERELERQREEEKRRAQAAGQGNNSGSSGSTNSSNTGDSNNTGTSSTFILPVQNSWVTSYYGEVRNLILQDGTRYSDVHSGIDYVNGNPTAPIFASASGRVIISSYMSGFGNVVVLQHDGGLYSWYAHLSSFSVGVGQSVNQGQQVGNMGSTGYSTGPHLHFAISKGSLYNWVNPNLYLNQ